MAHVLMRTFIVHRRNFSEMCQMSLIWAHRQPQFSFTVLFFSVMFFTHFSACVWHEFDYRLILSKEERTRESSNCWTKCACVCMCEGERNIAYTAAYIALTWYMEVFASSHSRLFKQNYYYYHHVHIVTFLWTCNLAIFHKVSIMHS